MAFNGTLLSMGGNVFPLKYIYTSSYKVTPYQRLDLDSFRNANGALIRNALSLASTAIKFQSKPMWNSDWAAMMKIIRGAFISIPERKLNITYYNPEVDGYRTGAFYVPDYEPSIMRVEGKRLFYDACNFEFIGYGESIKY